jgi:hypothetical protein
MTTEHRFRTLAVLFLVLLPALPPTSSPQDSPAGKATTVQEEQQPDHGVAIEALIARLGSDRPEERNTAMTELRKVGVAALPFLKTAFSKSGDAETRARLELLISEVDVSHPSPFFDCRRRGDKNAQVGQEEPEGSRDAVDAALRWLARHQNPDGLWSADRFDGRCSGTKCAGTGERDFDTGVTALAILAFLGAGYTQDSREELHDPADKSRVLKAGEVVRLGLKGLLSRQDSEGCVGERGSKYGYTHAIATLALAEAYGMTRADFLKVPAQKAADFLVACQNPGKGWRYSSRCGDNDSSVTTWAAIALKTAEFSLLRIPKATFEGALTWFDEATEENGYFQVGYNARSTGKVFIPGKNDQFAHHATMSGAAAIARIFLHKRPTEPVLAVANVLIADTPRWRENEIDFYYWHFGSLHLFQCDGPDGRMWKHWSTAMLRALTPNQKGAQDGCQAGSWDPSVERWGFEGGRVYATAINALTLETCRRYPILREFKQNRRR